MGWFIPSFISQSLILFGFVKKLIFFLCGFKKRPSWAWCGLQVCSEKWRWEAERIDWLELGKTLYSVFILHSGVFQSVVSSWFMISSEVFHIKKLVLIISFSHFTPMFLESDRSLNQKSYWFTVHQLNRWLNRGRTGDIINM